MSFHGDLSSNLITSLLRIVETKMDTLNASLKLKKRVFNVMVEAVQNLYHHAGGISGEMKQVTIAIAGKESSYYVATGNLVEAGAIEELKKNLDYILGLDPEELKEYYMKSLNEGQFSEKGGAGLGIIDLVRRSDGDFDYRLVPVSDDQFFFTLNIKVAE